MIHIPHTYLVSATVPLTVNVIGTGGTGSEILQRLVKLDNGIRAVGGIGLHVRMFDDAVVREANIGRQRFFASDVGLQKAAVMVTRCNRANQTAWEAYTEKYNYDTHPKANITISCVDDGAFRVYLNKCFKKEVGVSADECHDTTPLYWLDLGNGKNYGQGVLGTVGKHEQPLKTIMDIHPDLMKHDKPNEPSCSQEESLKHQDLFVNSEVAEKAAQLLWKLIIRNIGGLDSHGFYVNIEELTSLPLKIAA